MKIPSDQDLSSISVSALFNAYKHRQPVALLAGSGYSRFPFKLPREMGYCVLGYYAIKHVWGIEYCHRILNFTKLSLITAERHCRGVEGSIEGSVYGLIRYKFAFHWIESQGEPWWTHTSTPQSVSLSLVNELNEAEEYIPPPECESPQPLQASEEVLL